MSSLHISVAAEPIAHIGDFAITNSLFTTFILSLLIIFFAYKVSSSETSRLRLVVEMVIEGFYKFFHNILGERTIKLFPLTFTAFIFIILGSWIGLLPGVGSLGFWEESHGERLLVPIIRAPSADLNVTIALALISVVITQYLSIKALGAKMYISKYINFKNPINFVVGILEIISEFSKILSFSFRLFGNIFAGEVLLVVMTFLIPLFLPVPFLFLEIFVGLIQALVFTMLTSIFIAISTEHHD